jgi:hypothetical protein
MPRTRAKGSRHGLHRLMVAVKTKDLRALDRRCAGAKALLQWKGELLEALGGPDAISPQRAALVDAAVRGKLFLDAVDAWLLQQGSLVNGRRKSILPALAQRQSLADGLLRVLTTLGLDRVERDGGRLPESWVERVQPRDPDDPGKAGDGAAVPTANGTATEGRGVTQQ